MSVRVGFVGVGGMAGGHLNILRKFEDVQLAALCDINEELLARRRQEYAVEKVYTDYRAMFDAEELDAVYVVVPPFAHGEIEDHVAAKGCALFVEKPVELFLDAAIRKHEAIAKVGVLSAAGYCVRYMDTVDILRERVSAHAVELALGYYMGGAPGGWWQQRSKSGGQLVEQTTHIVDLARYVVGDVAAVGGAFVRRTPLNDTADIENASIAHVYYENGAVGTITSACMLSQGYKTGLDLFAKDFLIEYTYGSMRVRTPQGSEDFRPANNMYEAEDRVFIDAVKSADGSQIRSTYTDAVKSLEVSLLAYEASQKRTVLETRFRP
jgi:predicted dehydrogenase